MSGLCMIIRHVNQLKYNVLLGKALTIAVMSLRTVRMRLFALEWASKEKDA